MSVVRVSKGSSSSSVREHWTSESKEEIMELFSNEQKNYPTQGYGTILYNVQLDPTGLLYHAEFSRFNSCD